MNKKIIIAFIPIIAVMITIPLAYAQTTTNKVFYLGINPSGTLDDFTYNNGQQISYGVQGYPPVTVIIDNWQNISTVNKTLITVRLTGAGYTEGEEQTMLDAILGQ